MAAVNLKGEINTYNLDDSNEWKKEGRYQPFPQSMVLNCRLILGHALMVL